MKSTVNRKKRSKLTTILLAPIFAVVFLVGWSLYYIGESGHRQKQKPVTRTLEKREEIELMVMPKEEQTITA
jgi:hypothetical protein